MNGWVETVMRVDDRRQSMRHHVLRRGKIVFPDGRSVEDCIVLDLSSDGARLRVRDWLGLPTAFVLRLEKGPVYRAKVCYRDRNSLGVRFSDGVAS